MICQELNNKSTKAVEIMVFQFQRKQIKDDLNYLKENYIWLITSTVYI